MLRHAIIMMARGLHSKHASASNIGIAAAIFMGLVFKFKLTCKRSLLLQCQCSQIAQNLRVATKRHNTAAATVSLLRQCVVSSGTLLHIQTC